jgi:hypothetical protein
VGAVPRGDDALRIVVTRRALPRGYDEDLNLRVPRDGPGGLLKDLNVRAPRHRPGGLPPGLVVSGGANGATQEEGREPRHGTVAARAVLLLPPPGVRRNLQEPRHGVHAGGRGG